jgi:hypothetical protein
MFGEFTSVGGYIIRNSHQRTMKHEKSRSHCTARVKNVSWLFTERIVLRVTMRFPLGSSYKMKLLRLHLMLLDLSWFYSKSYESFTRSTCVLSTIVMRGSLGDANNDVVVFGSYEVGDNRAEEGR